MEVQKKYRFVIGNILSAFGLKPNLNYIFFATWSHRG